jgi:hypothetical protein
MTTGLFAFFVPEQSLASALPQSVVDHSPFGAENLIWILGWARLHDSLGAWAYDRQVAEWIEERDAVDSAAVLEVFRNDDLCMRFASRRPDERVPERQTMPIYSPEGHLCRVCEQGQHFGQVAPSLDGRTDFRNRRTAPQGGSTELVQALRREDQLAVSAKLVDYFDSTSTLCGFIQISRVHQDIRIDDLARHPYRVRS